MWASIFKIFKILKMFSALMSYIQLVVRFEKFKQLLDS